MNLSKSGIGISTGMKGFRIGIGPRGVRTTFSIPGTGISWASGSRAVGSINILLVIALVIIGFVVEHWQVILEVTICCMLITSLVGAIFFYFIEPRLSRAAERELLEHEEESRLRAFRERLFLRVGQQSAAEWANEDFYRESRVYECVKATGHLLLFDPPLVLQGDEQCHLVCNGHKLLPLTEKGHFNVISGVLVLTSYRIAFVGRLSTTSIWLDTVSRIDRPSAYGFGVTRDPSIPSSYIIFEPEYPREALAVLSQIIRESKLNKLIDFEPQPPHTSQRSFTPIERI